MPVRKRTATRLKLKNILRKAPAGVTEIMVHPGIPEESGDVYLANPGLERYLKLEDRRLELDACLQARQFVEGLNLCNFGSLADRQTSTGHG